MPSEILPTLPKCPTGIAGLDEVTGGGLPQGRPTLITGGAGCGKTFLAMHFLYLGATLFDEPGVFVAFEERAQDLRQNFASLDFDIAKLEAEGKLRLDYVHVERSEIEETGEYDLEGLFVRLGHAIDSIGAKRVVLDTIESLFSGFTNLGILRAELRRLFRWLKDKGVTAVITGEAGGQQQALTRHGLEEYVSDCVIVLDHRVTSQVSTRRLRIVKYRGTSHGTNEYPFLMHANGLSVLPITSVGLTHTVSTERLSSGVPRLDAMLGGAGYYRGSSILISGTAGTGKSSLAAHFVAAACTRGEKSLYFAFEESPTQVVRNMRSIGLDLQPHLDSGLLRIISERATAQGLEAHLISLHETVTEHEPVVAVFDPVTNLLTASEQDEVKSMLTRVIDFMKGRHISTLFTSLTAGGDGETSEVAMSSLMDTWILLRNLESGGERNRGLYVLKSRGMSHSNQVSEFILSDRGVDLPEAYLGSGEVLMGTARVVQEARDHADKEAREQETETLRRRLDRKRSLIAAQIAALQVELAAEEEDVKAALTGAEQEAEIRAKSRGAVSHMRGVDG